MNGAILKPARDGNGAELGGSGQYLTLGEFPDRCIGNLEHCTHGITMTLHVFPRQLPRDADTYIVSSQPYDVYYEGGTGSVVAEFRTAGRQWLLRSDQVASKTHQYMFKQNK